jgi:hypothetical protein
MMSKEAPMRGGEAMAIALRQKRAGRIPTANPHVHTIAFEGLASEPKSHFTSDLT